jgi:hypothetical protein
MQKSASKVGKDRRAKRTPTELRLRRAALQTYFDFVAQGELETLVATQPPEIPLPAGWEPSSVEAITQERKTKRTKKKGTA